MAYEELDQETRMWGMLCHLGGLTILTGMVGGNIVVPLIIWLLKREEHFFIDMQGKESMNFQISMTIYFSGLGVIAFATSIFVLPLFILLPLMSLVFIVQLALTVFGAVRANDGVPYRYPFTIRFFQ